MHYINGKASNNFGEVNVSEWKKNYIKWDSIEQTIIWVAKMCCSLCDDGGKKNWNFIKLNLNFMFKCVKEVFIRKCWNSTLKKRIGNYLQESILTI